jgi:hypothetical protein
MKKPILFFALLCGSLQAQPIITATLTVTNVPVTTNALNLNGVVRTWTNTPATANVQIQITNSIGNSTTNLFNNYAAFPAVPSVILGRSSSNVVTFQSYPAGAMSISITGTWASVSYSTNTLGTNAAVPRIPKSLEGNLQLTNIASGLIDWISDNAATNQVPLTAPAFAQFGASGLILTNGIVTLSAGTALVQNAFCSLTNPILLTPLLLNTTNFTVGVSNVVEGGRFTIWSTNNSANTTSASTNKVWYIQFRGR